MTELSYKSYKYKLTLSVDHKLLKEFKEQNPNVNISESLENLMRAHIA